MTRKPRRRLKTQPDLAMLAASNCQDSPMNKLTAHGLVILSQVQVISGATPATPIQWVEQRMLAGYDCTTGMGDFVLDGEGDDSAFDAEDLADTRAALANEEFTPLDQVRRSLGLE